MPTVDPARDELPLAIARQLTNAERANVARFENLRRFNLLRVIVPSVLILATMALPLAIAVDVVGHTLASSLQCGYVVAATLAAFVALRRNNVQVATTALFIGIAGVLYLVVADDALFSGPLTLRTLPEFGLLLIPMILAGVLGTRWQIVLITVATPIATALTLALTAHDAGLTQALMQSDGAAIYAEPIAMQVIVGILVLAMANTLRQTQRDLNTARILYARERELDRLKNQFISNVNHELRTPLMSMQGYLTLARELGRRQESAQQEYMLARGLDASQHMEGIVQAILDVRRIEIEAAHVDLAPTRLHEVVVAAANLLDGALAGGQERALELGVPADLVVLAEADKVRQMMLNLLTNACKYSPAGSPVAVRARVVTQPGKRRGEPPRDMAEISVRDHGLGIPLDQTPLLFERFVRLERDIASNVKGTGLGLALCRAFVEAMGGTIWVESAGVEGEGSTFRFTLPLATAAEPVATPASPVLMQSAE